MFIKFDRCPITDGFILVDSDFVQDVYAPLPEHIVLTYRTRSLPILPNLKLYYKQLPIKIRMLKLDKDADSLAIYYSHLKFKDNYYNCLKNYIQILNFIRQ